MDDTIISPGAKDISAMRPELMMRLPELYSRAASKMRLCDLNGSNQTSASYTVYGKEDITNYLAAPEKNEDALRSACLYLYGASPHFRRIIQYFVGLTDLSYVILPYNVDPKSANVRIINLNYRKTLKILSSMDIKTQFPKILTVCLREDTFFGTMHVGGDKIIIQQLPSKYCKISCIENNVFNVSFDFSYFDLNKNLLDFYPAEFRQKYEGVYKKSRRNKWIDLDAPTSFAIKCNTDITNYSMPPFAGILRDIYDLETYRQLKLDKTAIENYAMLFMKLEMDDDGTWKLDYDKAVDFWSNLDKIVPEEIGTVLTPMDVSKISFEKSNVADTNTVADAEQEVFSSAGVSSLLFNNEKASSGALTLSIKADQAITFGIVKSIQDMVNRFIQYQSYGKNFKVEFLDCSPYNRKEMGDLYLKACQFGIPMVSYYCASQGLGQAELDSMNFLENKVLDIKNTFIPLKSSATQSSSGDITGEAGAPEKDLGDLSDSGEQSREDSDDWG